MDHKLTRSTSVIVVLAVAGFALAAFVFSGRGFTRHLTVGSRYVPQTRTYFVAAENVTWDYAPGGKDPYADAPIPDPWGKQTKYQKVRYVEYTDDTFMVKKPQPAWLGILGPVIRGVEGDTIKVVFFNKADMPYSMHPHGVRYDKDSEGATMGMGMPTDPALEGKGAKVMPGEKFTYVWHANADSAPTAGEGGSKVWWYHSHVDATQDVYDGLLGPIIITSAAHARPNGTPDDADKEFVTAFVIFDESKPGMSAAEKEASLKHTINGYVFDNLPGLVMDKGDRVRWHLLGIGNEADLHTPHWHGGVVLDRETDAYTDVVELLPGSMKTVDMVADNVGEWMYHCHVADHVKAGMTAIYTINP